MKSLAGTLMVYNGQKFDYCFMEAIECLAEFCDHIIVVAGGDDGTYEMIEEKYGELISLIRITEKEWNEQKGKEKLHYFTNIAINYAEVLGYEYQFNIQADEILSEISYGIVRKVIESNGEGFMCKRINLWKDCNHQLNVPQNRLPCSSEIIRLAKTKYRSCGDAESLDVPDVNQNYTNLIEIWHYGFVRKREVMKSKIVNMQEAVFGIDHDPKLDQSEIFNPDLWFDPAKDLKLIKGEHPLIMQKWIQSRP
jgi:hypothetical protein